MTRQLCECRRCSTCMVRASKMRRKAKALGQPVPDWAMPLTRPKRERPAPIASPETTPVTWHEDLTALRRALPIGAAVGLGQGGVVVSLVGEETRKFPTFDAALDWATDPQAIHRST
jgi:hypothetical protein